MAGAGYSLQKRREFIAAPRRCLLFGPTPTINGALFDHAGDAHQRRPRTVASLLTKHRLPEAHELLTRPVMTSKAKTNMVAVRKITIAVTVTMLFLYMRLTPSSTYRPFRTSGISVRT